MQLLAESVSNINWDTDTKVGAGAVLLIVVIAAIAASRKSK